MTSYTTIEQYLKDLKDGNIKPNTCYLITGEILKYLYDHRPITDENTEDVKVIVSALRRIFERLLHSNFEHSKED